MVEKDLFAWEVKKDDIFEGFVYAHDRIGAKAKLKEVIVFRKDRVRRYSLGDKVIKISKKRYIRGNQLVIKHVQTR